MYSPDSGLGNRRRTRLGSARIRLPRKRRHRLDLRLEDAMLIAAIAETASSRSQRWRRTPAGCPRRAADNLKHLRGGCLLLERLGQLARARLHLFESRTFSMAITAWSAKVSTSSICFSVKVATWLGEPYDADRITFPQKRHAECGPVATELLALVQRILRIGQDILNVNGPALERRSSGDSASPGSIGLSSNSS